MSKVGFGLTSYIGIEKAFVQKQTVAVGVGQTAPPKITAMFVGCCHIFCGRVDFTSLDIPDQISSLRFAFSLIIIAFDMESTQEKVLAFSEESMDIHENTISYDP